MFKTGKLLHVQSKGEIGQDKDGRRPMQIFAVGA